VKFVRGESMFGKSFVYVIFEDGTDIYWARSRVIEYLNSVRGSLPEGVNPVIGPDATGVGWVYEYALVDETGQHSLAELRSFQDWHLRYALESVKGVAEVAPVGGFVKEYQVDLDPNKLAAYGIPLSDVVAKIRDVQQRRRGEGLRGGVDRVLRPGPGLHQEPGRHRGHPAQGRPRHARST
jgi:Cu(I)/Ag(I) efflux system membrane protein CusA/SilA